jgi:hypothetical protein
MGFNIAFMEERERARWATHAKRAALLAAKEVYINGK